MVSGTPLRGCSHFFVYSQGCIAHSRIRSNGSLPWAIVHNPFQGLSQVWRFPDKNFTKNNPGTGLGMVAQGKERSKERDATLGKG